MDQFIVSFGVSWDLFTALKKKNHRISPFIRAHIGSGMAMLDVNQSNQLSDRNVTAALIAVQLYCTVSRRF